eukprot:scaffold32561_cov32-Cyclotella_meneghiniana.AAC.4
MEKHGVPDKPLLRFQDNTTKYTLGTRSALEVELLDNHTKTTEEIEAEAMMERARREREDGGEYLAWIDGVVERIVNAEKRMVEIRWNEQKVHEDDVKLGSKFLFRGTFRERAKVREFLQGREFRGISGNIEGK